MGVQATPATPAAAGLRLVIAFSLTAAQTECKMSPMRSRSSSGEVKEQGNSPAPEIKRTVVSRSRSRSAHQSRSRRKRSSSTRRRSYDRSRSNSRRRSRSRSRGRRSYRSRSRSGRRSRSRSSEGYRLHVGDINEDCRKRDLEKIFSKYGRLKEIWLATYAPFYAFINYESKSDMEYACQRTNGEKIAGKRIRVSRAKPRKAGPRRRRYSSDRR